MKLSIPTSNRPKDTTPALFETTDYKKEMLKGGRECFFQQYRFSCQDVHPIGSSDQVRVEIEQRFPRRDSKNKHI